MDIGHGHDLVSQLSVLVIITSYRRIKIGLSVPKRGNKLTVWHISFFIKVRLLKEILILKTYLHRADQPQLTVVRLTETRLSGRDKSI